jgi:hypothetical protein
LAKKPSRLSRILANLGGPTGQPEIQPLIPTISTPKDLISKNERMRYIERLTVASQSTVGTVEGIQKYIKQTTSQLSITRKDNAEIAKLAPEIDQAAAIVIPSILSPNDLRDSPIQFISTSTQLDEDQNNKISTIITDYFNKSLNFESKVPEWLHEALYRSGSKSILMVPLSELDHLFNNPDNFINNKKANESLNATADNLIKESLFGISNESGIDNISIKNMALESFTISSIEEHVVPEIENTKIIETFRSRAKSYDRSKLGKVIYEFAELITSTENFAITDNPDIIKKSSMQKQFINHMTASLKTKYKTAHYIPLSGEPSVSEGQTKPIHGEHPLFMELPSQAVIPVFIPGSPSEHLGYFIAIDDMGNPVHIIETNEQNFKMNSTEQRSTFDNLFKAFGFEDMKIYGTGMSKVMVDVYQQIMDKYLVDILAKGGLNNVKIGMDNSLYKCMFSRYLARRKTRLLFVPKDLLSYICYEYNENGTGRSQLEDIKFVLSLRTTVLICKYLSALTNSVDRRHLTISVNENTGNPFQLMEDIKREYINKALLSFSYNPDEIARSLAQRSISATVNGLPGMPEWKIDNDTVQRTSPDFDERFDEDIINMMLAHLKVPPAAMNALRENEYSRSVATQNLFFSRYIHKMQGKTIYHLSDVGRKYIRWSPVLQKAIHEATRSTEDAKDQGTIASYNLEEVINAIHVKLPSPNVAPDKAQFEELTAFIDAIDKLIESVYNEEIASGNAELQDTIKSIRSAIKAQIISKYTQLIGVTGSFVLPDMTQEIPEDVLKILQSVLNVNKGIKDQYKLLLPPEANPEEDTGDNSFGGDTSDTGGSATFDSAPEEPALDTPPAPNAEF